MTYAEADIRDSLAACLTDIEAGLTLVDTEVPLPNAIGARGRIDILANDRFGNFVVIEVKRADQTARQALHEVLKYAELLTREHGIESHRIRLVIASTTWHELTVPFSALARVSPYQLDGVTLTVDASGGVVSISPVEALPAVSRGGISQEQLVLLWHDSSRRDAAWDLLEPHLEGYGLTDLLGIALNYEGDSGKVITPYALLLVPGRMSLDEARRLGYLDEESHESGSLDDPFIEEPEGEALNQLMAALDTTNDDAEAHSSERFARDLQTGWAPVRVHRSGVFAAAAYVPDEEIIRQVIGAEGDNSVVFEGHSAPSHASGWAEMVLRTSVFLRWNERWQGGVAAWLTKCEQDGSVDCRIRIYELFDCIRGLIAAAALDDGRWLDTLTAVSQQPDGDTVELIGVLAWNGSGVGPEAALSEVFEAGVEDYLFLGHDAGTEPQLLTAMGLEHRLWERRGSELVEWTEDGPGGPADTPQLASILEFASRYRNELERLKLVIEGRSIGFFG